ncbi:hypothetical protein HMPREF1979_01088 [Actinomyces johnsonii F0542]|uniref:Uncharacterized protein n=1 Tax=Actinomyces johnsonii F0542 TaxID=1321818 RepID=U1RYL7_9ACTO|nr:hypothetical protein HMPREF1979_01088 [Actinomyces johnsonii F0542]
MAGPERSRISSRAAQTRAGAISRPEDRRTMMAMTAMCAMSPMSMCRCCRCR